MKLVPLVPLRRRGTEDQRIRRIKKWTRRGRIDLVRRHFAGVWKLFCRTHPFDLLDLEPIDGVEELKRQIRVRLLTTRGGWFMEPRCGVPLFSGTTPRPGS